uniref:Neuropeptide-like protein 46 n=1 Tax=Ascaris suum TaxID=6253 RepID=A0A2S1VVN6_ASCSU|nr:neuropeptide-like protein precursor 46 [Ascaris suum]
MQYGYSIKVLLTTTLIALVISLPVHDADYSSKDQYRALEETPILYPANILFLRGDEYADFISPRAGKRNIAIGRGDGFRPGK